MLSQRERKWINSTLFVFEHDGNLRPLVRPDAVSRAADGYSNDAEIRARQILRGGSERKKDKREEGWGDGLERHENSSRCGSMWRETRQHARGPRWRSTLFIPWRGSDSPRSSLCEERRAVPCSK